MVSDPVSLNSLTFSLVGPGKVGASLAHWLVSVGARLAGVASKSSDSARILTDTFGGYPTSSAEIESGEDDLLLIAVPDTALEEVTLTLARHRQAPVVLHTSGRFPGEILAPLRLGGSAIGSLHPLKAFPSVLVDPLEAKGTVFGIDGDDPACALAERIAGGLSGTATPIPPAIRSHYHLAATLAAGGVVTLLATAAELAEQVGLDRDVVVGYLELARNAIQQARSSDSLAAAITGPIARGHLDEYQAQIDEVRALNPTLANFLEELAKQTLHHCKKATHQRG